MELKKELETGIRLSGSVEINRVLDRSGNQLPVSSIIEGGESVIATIEKPFVLGSNLVVNLGRTIIARLLGGQGDLSGYLVNQVSFGTGSEPPRYDDATLSPQRGGEFDGGENQIEITTGVYKKAFDSVDFPGSYLVRYAFSMDYEECNGETVREFGLWATNTLFARKTVPGIMKSGDQRVELSWVIRA